MKRKLYLILAAVLFTTFTATTIYAQDVIVTKKGEKIEAKITEIGLETVKYKEFDHLDGPDYVIKKSEIASILYANGKVLVFSEEKEKEKETKPLKEEEKEKKPSSPPPDLPQNNYRETEEYKDFKSLNDRKMADFLEKNDLESFEIFRKGKHLKRAGVGLLVPGLVLTVAGITLTSISLSNTNSNGNFNYQEDYDMYASGVSLLCIGQTMVVISIPLQAVAGGLKQRGKNKYEQKFFMGQKTYAPSFHLDIYGNGLGMTMKF
jgi:hypothetical protein